MSQGLSVDRVSYRYGDKVALDAVSFDVAPGRFAALLGPNGAGKSTLFSLLTRLFTTGDGRISIAGQDMGRTPRAALARMGVVFQSPTLDLDLTIRQNLSYFAALHGLSGRDARRRIDAALDRLEIRARAGEKARNLNGGHRRRTEIARALVHDPSVLLLDEPMAGLGSQESHEMVDLLRTLKGKHSILLIEHDMDAVFALADRISVLVYGHIIATGTPQEIRDNEAVQHAYLGEE